MISPCERRGKGIGSLIGQWCVRCPAPIEFGFYSVVREDAFVHVAMGTLVDGPSIRPTKHIFVRSKAPWFTITDDLPQHEEHVVAYST
jgi:hypothetical protein